MSAPAFRTDVTIRGPTSQTLLDRPKVVRGLTSSEYLDGASENVNKQIDQDVKALLEAFEALVSLSRIRDKDKYRIAQETLELEARSDVMVRAAQSLTLLSHSLKLSLLLSQEPIDSPNEDDRTLDEEAIQLIRSTAEEKKRCARLLKDMFGLDDEEEGAGHTEGKGEKDNRNVEGREQEGLGKAIESTELEESKAATEFATTHSSSAAAETKRAPEEEEDLELEAVE